MSPSRQLAVGRGAGHTWCVRTGASITSAFRSQTFGLYGSVCLSKSSREYPIHAHAAGSTWSISCVTCSPYPLTRPARFRSSTVWANLCPATASITSSVVGPRWGWRTLRRLLLRRPHQRVSVVFADTAVPPKAPNVSFFHDDDDDDEGHHPRQPEDEILMRSQRGRRTIFPKTPSVRCSPSSRYTRSLGMASSPLDEPTAASTEE